MKKLHLPIIVEMDEDGCYIVSCPLRRACHPFGKTVEEAMEKIKEVVLMCLKDANIEDLNISLFSELDERFAFSMGLQIPTIILTCKRAVWLENAFYYNRYI